MNRELAKEVATLDFGVHLDQQSKNYPTGSIMPYYYIT
jgi:hypothetical protein